jgi:hypothetical protein
VLSGGGARGAFQVGVYERLLEDPRFADGPAVLSGTSAGGINAALIAAGKSPHEMLRFWKEIADDPPVTASSAFFEGALRTLLRLGLEESARWLWTRQPARALLHRLRNHWPPRPGNLLALWVEYLLTARFELVSRFLEGIREPFVADTAPLRARLVEAFGGERVPNRGLRLALNTVDAHTGQIIRYVTAPAPLPRSSDYVVVDAITVERTVDSFLENAYNVDRKLLLERNRLTRLQGGPYREVILYDAVRPLREACFNAGSYLYFERHILSAMYQAGRRAATSWLAAGPRVDHLDEPTAALAAPLL